MNAWVGKNRRRFPRLQYPCLVTIRYGLGTKHVMLSHTENLGVGGICVTLKESIKLFTPVDLELDLLDMEDHIKCTGKVVWSIRRGSAAKEKPFFYDVGIEFIKIADKDHPRIEKVINRLEGNVKKPAKRSAKKT